MRKRHAVHNTVVDRAGDEVTVYELRHLHHQ
ncbi:uncharacterized protein G2W53_003719 [Senna tora]|uniref:Uncharacterized protein n=1 Tax=Senna tora TaxID=362788 RepID=A0A835CG08_9FABA|nr:uncharacterized protein G2W53_003719 [Senna tora]